MLRFSIASRQPPNQNELTFKKVSGHTTFNLTDFMLNKMRLNNR